MRGLGSRSLASRVIRSQAMACFWLRRRSVCLQSERRTAKAHSHLNTHMPPSPSRSSSAHQLARAHLFTCIQASPAMTPTVGRVGTSPFQMVGAAERINPSRSNTELLDPLLCHEPFLKTRDEGRVRVI